MKILKISFSNINNLKGGPHVLSFETSPLSSAGIFAILGPTGSGKSTILDVITLALFNRIPRFKRPISKGEMSGLGSVLTHHTNEASAQIEYAINGQRYLSKWEISKTRTGNLKDYEMSLQKEDGSYYDLKKSEVPAKNEAIIGLQYDQFIKSIILSQGEFSKFLKADKNERGLLLENITGTKIYRRIGQLAYLKHKEVKASVELELSKLGEIQTLSEEERKGIEKSSQELSKKKTEFDKNIQLLLSTKSTKEEIKQFSISIEEKKLEFSALKQSKIDFQKELGKLVIHEKLSPLQADVTTYLAAKENRIATEKNLANYTKFLNKATTSLKQVIQQMADLTGEKVTENNFITKMSSFEKEIINLDNDINNLTKQGTELRKNVNLKLVDYRLEIDSKIQPKEISKRLNDQNIDLKNNIKNAGFESNVSVQDIRIKIKNDQTNKEKLSILKGFQDSLNIAETNFNKCKEQLAQFERQIDKTIPLAEKTMSQFQSLKEIETLLVQQKQDAIKIASLSDRRKDLVSGEPCPLCGSNEHPFTEHLPEDKASEIDNKILKNKSAITTEEKRLKELKDLLTSAEVSKKITLRQKDQYQKEISQWTAKIKGTEIEGIPTLPKSSKETLNAIELLNTSLKLREEGLESLEQIKINEALSKGFHELAELTTKFKSKHAQRKEKFSGDNPAQICNELQDQFHKFKTSILENNKAIEIESKDLQRASDLLNKTSDVLNPKVKKLGFSSIDSLKLNLLTDTEFQKIKKQQEGLIKSESAIKSLLENITKNQQRSIKKDKHPDLTLESIQASLAKEEQQRDALNQQLGNYEAQIKQDDSLKSRRKDKETIIADLNKKLERWSLMNKIIGDAKGSRFANFAQGLTLQNLLVFTNKRLLKLSDRYLLDQPGDDGTLRVIDQYQGNIQRAVSTLSGGETFLISLALALSLSDMASKNVALESLFIDEGFGTLDQDTLDIALNTLEKLQSESQKTVGVISHVEALKERINVQIKLSKNAQGYSKILIEGAN